MRDFDPAFATELAALQSNPFWSVVVHFDAGDLWIAGRENNAGAIAHAVIMVDLAAIGASSGRSEPTQLDVGGTDLAFVNIPKQAGMPGPLATGERFFDRWVRNLESILADVYLNFETTPGTYVRERLFAAVCSSPSSVGYLVGSLHLASRTERYLNASVLRKLSPVFYPFAAEEDSTATVPIVIGSAPMTPGRIVKATRSTVPVAAETNSSGAQLLRPIVDPTYAIAETWTVEMQATETPAFSGATNGQQSFNLAANSGSTEPMCAESFTIAGTQRLRSVGLKIVGSGDVAAVGHSRYCQARVEIWTDSAGNPGARVSADAVAFAGFSPQAAATFPVVTFRNPPTLAAGTYWLVLFASPGGHAGTPWTTITSTQVNWCKASGGGFAGGTAKKGTKTRVTYSTVNVFLTHVPSGVTWDSALAAQDFWFRLNFDAATFTLTGSVTGADGIGTANAFFESDSGAITIPSDRWQGVPVAGDSFTFMVDPSDAKIILSESPAATPVGAISAVYLDGDRIADGTTMIEERSSGDPPWNAPWRDPSLTGDIGKVGFLTLGEDAPGPTPPALYPKEYGNEWKAIFWPVDVVGTQTFRRIGWQVFRSAPSAEQQNALFYEIYAEGVSGAYRVPDRNRVLASVQVPFVDLTITGGGYMWVYVDLPHPITVTDQRIYVAIRTEQFSTNDFFEVPVTDNPVGTGPPGVGVLWSHNGPFYVGHDFLPGVSLVAANVTTELSVDDGTGHFIADVLLDFEIPDGSKVTADVAGFTDDSSGTYTGIAGGLLFTPSQVFHWLLNRAGAVDADIDLLDSFTISEGFYKSAGYRFDGVIQDDTTFKALLLKLAYECRSSFDWVDKATLRIQVAELDTAAATITLDDILPDSDRVPVLSLERSPDSELINSLTVKYNRVLADTKYRGIIARNVPASIALYGLLERTDLQTLDFVRVASMAQDVVDTRLARQAYPIWRIAFSTLLPWLAVEKDDGIALDLTNAAEGGDVLGGWDGSSVLQVESMVVQPELPGVDFVLRELNVDVEIADGDGYTAPLSVVVLLDQGDLTTTYDYLMGYPPHSRWSDPSTSGGTQYDGIDLGDGWTLYIENGERKWSDAAFAGSKFVWTGPPAARVNADEILEIDF